MRIKIRFGSFLLVFVCLTFFAVKRIATGTYISLKLAEHEYALEAQQVLLLQKMSNYLGK